MSEAALALQMAMLACLRADDAVTAFVGDRVFDAAPRNAAFPYIAFGPARASDWSTGTEDGSEHRITLHAWSRGRGKRECWEIMRAVEAALGGMPALEGHTLINLRVEFTEAQREADGLTWRGTARLRAVTEPL